jgi:hypothetical protein
MSYCGRISGGEGGTVSIRHLKSIKGLPPARKARLAMPFPPYSTPQSFGQMQEEAGCWRLPALSPQCWRKNLRRFRVSAWSSTTTTLMFDNRFSSISLPLGYVRSLGPFQM